MTVSVVPHRARIVGRKQGLPSASALSLHVIFMFQLLEVREWISSRGAG